MLGRFLDHDRRERGLASHGTSTAHFIAQCPAPAEDLARVQTMPLRNGVDAGIGPNVSATIRRLSSSLQRRRRSTVMISATANS